MSLPMLTRRKQLALLVIMVTGSNKVKAKAIRRQRFLEHHHPSSPGAAGTLRLLVELLCSALQQPDLSSLSN